jgi:hypothetical protein
MIQVRKVCVLREKQNNKFVSTMQLKSFPSIIIYCNFFYFETFIHFIHLFNYGVQVFCMLLLFLLFLWLFVVAISVSI